MSNSPGHRLLAPMQAYLLAIAGTMAAFALRILADESFRGFPGLLIFAVPIVASAYFGGLRGGFVATALSCLAAYGLLLMPLRPLVVEPAMYRWLVLAIAVAGTAIALLCGALHRARERASRLAGEQARAQARLMAAQAVGKVGSWETDPTTGEVTWSEELHRIFGTSPREFSPTHEGFLQRVHPDDRDRVSRAFGRSLLDGTPCSIEHRIVAADGRTRFVEERWQAFPPDGKGAVRVIGTCQDIDERKLAADALEELSSRTRQREAMLSLTLSATRDFVFLLDRDGRFIYANQALLEMWGQRMENVAGKDFTGLGYPAEPAARLAEQVRQVVDTGISLTDETLYTTPAGWTGCFEYILSPALGADGTVDYIAGSARDITARKRAENELAAKHSLLENAQRVGGMGIWEHDLESDRVTWSRETFSIYGLTPVERYHTPEAFYALVHADDRALVRQTFSVESLARGAQEAEFRITRPDGAERVLFGRGELALDSGGQPARRLGVVMDVTERRRAERALREAEASYRALFENSSDGIFQNTPDGRMLAANPAMARMMGYESAEEFVRDRTDVARQTYVQPSDRARFAAQIEAQGSIQGFEYEVRRKDGTRMWVCENVRVVRNAAGEAVRYEGSMRDISARKRAEAELSRAHAELVEASRRGGKAEVAAEVLHSVGNVLNSVNVSAGLMAEQVKDGRSARMASVVALVRAHHADIGDYFARDPAGRHVPQLLEDLSGEWVAQQAALVAELGELRANVDLIKRIVAAQRAHAGAEEKVETIALPELLEEALGDQQEALVLQRVRIVRDFQAVDPVCAPRYKVVQILVSLLRHARRACKEIDEADRTITLRVAPLDEFVSVSVSDNGAGIAGEDLARLFMPNFRIGSGGPNGLHSAAIAAGELGGGLGAHSDGPGTGVTLTLRLPRQRVAEAA